jgi:hypothetical protein
MTIPGNRAGDDRYIKKAGYNILFVYFNTIQSSCIRIKITSSIRLFSSMYLLKSKWILITLS